MKALGRVLVTLVDVGTSSIDILTKINLRRWKQPS